METVTAMKFFVLAKTQIPTRLSARYFAKLLAKSKLAARNKRSAILNIAAALALCLFSLPSLALLENYRLAADDTISIIVYDEPDLSLKKVRISTSGTVSIPLIGQVKVSGLTAAQVEEKLTDLFKDGYLKKPAITVSIDEYRYFYINGEVNNPGGYSYREGLTVHKAVTLAGGFSKRAAKDSITLQHEDAGKKGEKKAKLSDPIRPGDIITIKQSFF